MDGPATDLELAITGIAGGGDGLGHDAGGRVVFVPGAAPGDTVRVRLIDERARFARGVVVEVVSPAPGRVTPPCPHVAEGCGGCGWQHLDLATQRELKATIVSDALHRIGRLDEVPDIAPGPDLASTGHRTTVQGAVIDGRFAYRRAASHDLVEADGCLTAHPLARELIDNGSFGDATGVTLRVGVATGERLAVLEPSIGDGVSLPDDVIVTGTDELRAGRRAWLHEEVAGRRWMISARSFFQTRPDGAEALVEKVRDLVAGVLGPDLRLVDLYAGVGLFAGTLGGGGGAGHIVAVESGASAAHDARANLADLGDMVTVVKADVDRWRPSPADLVIADPARKGLGVAAVERVAATGAPTVVLVSCDPASLGRDAGLLTAAGYRLTDVTLVDLFPHTPHIEAVSRFVRGRVIQGRVGLRTMTDTDD